MIIALMSTLDAWREAKLRFSLKIFERQLQKLTAKLLVSRVAFFFSCIAASLSIYSHIYSAA
eukprot:c27634_g1_i1 orf=54-239(+)